MTGSYGAFCEQTKKQLWHSSLGPSARVRLDGTDERRVERGGERGGPDPARTERRPVMKIAQETAPFEGVSRAPASTGGLLQLPGAERLASRIISTTVPAAETLGV